MGRVRSHRIVVPRRGGPDVLRVVENDLPDPPPGEARIRVLTAGVSAFDLMVRAHRFPGNPRPPYTPGEDFVGVVDAVGDDVTSVAIGQRVAGWTFGDAGTYAEHITRPAAQLVPVPDGLDAAVAVALVVNYLTAHLYLHQTGEVADGERILVHGAAGGLGSALVQLGVLAGTEVYGTASSRHHALVTSLGATPIDYQRDDFERLTLAVTGDGVDAVFDTIGGGRQLWRSYRTLRAGGRLVPIGSVATERSGMKVIPLSLLTIGLLKLVPDGKKVPLSPNMMKYPQAHHRWYVDTMTELLDLAATGKIDPLVAARIPLHEAGRAHELLEQGGQAGKVVLVAAEQ